MTSGPWCPGSCYAVTLSPPSLAFFSQGFSYHRFIVSEPQGRLTAASGFALTEGGAHGSFPHLTPLSAEMPPFGEPVYLKYPFHLLILLLCSVYFVLLRQGVVM